MDAPAKKEKKEKKDLGKKKTNFGNANKKILAQELGTTMLGDVTQACVANRMNNISDNGKQFLDKWPAAEAAKNMGDMAEKERVTLANDLIYGRIEQRVSKVNGLVDKLKQLEKVLGGKSESHFA